MKDEGTKERLVEFAFDVKHGHRHKRPWVS